MLACSRSDRTCCGRASGGCSADIVRFYREAPLDARRISEDRPSLGDYLAAGGYSDAFRNHYILPLASAIWSAAPAEIIAYPAAAFLRFQDNHGLLRLRHRPTWRTVKGGSQQYVSRLTRSFAAQIRTDAAIARIERVGRQGDRSSIARRAGNLRSCRSRDPCRRSARLLPDASEDERALLGAFRYSRNEAILHTDEGMMPRRAPSGRAGTRLAPPPAPGARERHLLDEPAAEPGDHDQRLRDAQSDPRPCARAACSGSRATSTRCSTRRRSPRKTAVGLAGRAQHLVLRRLFRFGISRGWVAGGTGGGRAIGRGSPPLARRRRIFAHRRWPRRARPPSPIGRRRRDAALGLYLGSVFHRRFAPKAHYFRYRLCWLLIDLDELATLDNRLWLFSHNRANLFSLHDRDHGDGGATPLRAAGREAASPTTAIDIDGGAVQLLCMPRTLGVGFNPLSVYWCYRRDGRSPR